MKKLLLPLKAHVRPSTTPNTDADANLLRLFALLYQADIENKERVRATESSDVLTKKGRG